MSRHPDITALIEALRTSYGASFAPYGTSDEEENGTGFRIRDIAATFSAACPENTPPGHYDVQIESYPPGDYIYTDIMCLGDLLRLVEKYRQPVENWPVTAA